MSTIDVLELLAAADPFAPDTALPSQALTVTVARSEVHRRIDMETKQSAPQRDTSRDGKRKAPMWWAAVAAFVAILVIGVASAVLLRSTDSEPAAPSTTTIPTTTTIPPTSVPADQISPEALNGTWDVAGRQWVFTASGTFAYETNAGDERGDFRTTGGSILTLIWDQSSQLCPGLGFSFDVLDFDGESFRLQSNAGDCDPAITLNGARFQRTSTEAPDLQDTTP